MPISRTIPNRRKLQAVAYAYILGKADSLAFHALDDVNGVYVNDVIQGVGAYTEADVSTRYYPDDTATPIWQPFTTGVPGKVYAGGKWWGVGQPALTNLQIRSFNLADPEWTAANMTVTLNQTGMRNDANGASLLVATAANATVIANVIVAASADQTTRWFLKRSTGTGPVEITVDNGTTWQAVTTETDLTTGFNEALESLAATTNIQIGIRVVTSGDAVIVGNAGAYTAKTASQVRKGSPAFTVASTTSVNTTDLSFDDANHDDTQGLWSCVIRNAGINAANSVGILGLGASGRLFWTDAFQKIISWDGTNQLNGTAVGLNADDTEYNFLLAYGDGKMRLRTDSAWVAEGNYDGAYNNTIGKLRLLGQNTFNDKNPQATVFIRDIRRYNLSYAAAQAQAEILSP